MQVATEIGGRTVRQARQAFAHAKDARHVYWYVGGVTVVLAVLVGAALIVGRALLAAAPEPAATPGKFVSYRPLGHFLNRLPDGRTCRYMTFDNNIGEAVEDKIGRCEEFVLPPTLGGRAAVPSLDMRPAKFSWGGQ